MPAGTQVRVGPQATPVSGPLDLTTLDACTPLPSLSVADAMASEGDEAAVFDVTLSAASGDTVTVDYATANDTAQASADYTAVGGTLTFLPGNTLQTVEVPRIGDPTRPGRSSIL